MNIFFLDYDVAKSAQYHCDRHVVKMVLETAQLLCGAHHVTGTTEPIPYKSTHKNHPCAVWTRESITNYFHLCQLGLELCKEYTYRYGKRHKTQDVIEWCINNPISVPDRGLTQPPRAMPDEYKVDCVVESYRNYYIGAKKRFATWKKRETPSWFSI